MAGPSAIAPDNVSESASDPSGRSTSPLSVRVPPSSVARPAMGVSHDPSSVSRNCRSDASRRPVGVSWIAASISAVFVSSRRRSMPMAPCATAGSISVVSTGVAGTSVMSSRLRPAQAKKVQVATPSESFFNRVCTLPRNSTTFRSGRLLRSCARLRSDDVPTVAPCARSVRRESVGDTKASRTSSRGR